MSEKIYILNKMETDILSNLLNIARIQEELLNAITDRYKGYIVNDIFKRLDIDSKLFVNTSINLGTGQLILKIPDEKKDGKS